MMVFDYFIIGDNLTAYSAAITLENLKKKVAIILLGDEHGLKSLATIKPTSFQNERLSGSKIKLLLDKQLSEKKITCFLCISDDIKIANYKNLIRIEVTDIKDKKSFLTKKIIYTPYLAPTLKYPEFIKKSQNCFGHGLSFCAWSDAFFSKGKEVCVIGDGYMALNQIEWCNKEDSPVTFLCTTNQYDSQIYLDVDIENITKLFLIDVEISLIKMVNKECVVRYKYKDNTIEKSFASIFWAPDVIGSYDFMDTILINVLQKEGKLYLAGMLVGINPWQHKELWNNGIDVALGALR